MLFRSAMTLTATDHRLYDIATEFKHKKVVTILEEFIENRV
jgi:hypothetical protein